MAEDRGAFKVPTFLGDIERQVKRCRQGASFKTQRLGIVAGHANVILSDELMPDNPLRYLVMGTYNTFGYSEGVIIPFL
jgi:hypothetical protein